MADDAEDLALEATAAAALDGGGPPGGIDLATAIGAVRRQIARAIVEGRDQAPRFRAGPVELELEVGYTGTAGVGGGVKVWVLSLEGKGEATVSRTHRVKVTLTPVDDRGGDRLIGDIGPR